MKIVFLGISIFQRGKAAVCCAGNVVAIFFDDNGGDGWVFDN